MEVSSALAMPEADSLAMTDSLSFGQYADADVLADASAASLADLASQKFFTESETGILAGL